ncbi:MAG TPA: 50S ribosomal protein L11 methyltransferase [Acidothermaceae bacterium]
MTTVDHHIAVMASTTLQPVPLVPEIVLHCAANAYEVWTLTGAGDESAPMPFWSFPWAGGQAVARYLLDQPHTVRGRSVLDLAAGSGLVGIAAALAGASQVMANDIDPYAAAAQELNARANGVTLITLTGDLLGDTVLSGDGLDADLSAADIVLAGDVCYERELSDRMLAFLLRCRARGADVLLGDPGRTYLPREHLTPVASYEVPTTLELEDRQLKSTTVFRLR